MGNTLGAKKYWFDWFPIQEHVIDGAKPSSALIVDVSYTHPVVCLDIPWKLTALECPRSVVEKAMIYWPFMPSIQIRDVLFCKTSSL